VSDGERPGRRRLVGGLAAGAGAAVAAGWAAQHRLVTRARVGDDDVVAEGLTLPDGLSEHVVETDDGGTLHVVECGQGTPVVLLHGFMLAGSLWAHQLRDLAARHRVVAVDLRGHGRSVPGTDGFSAPGASAPRARGHARGRAGARAAAPGPGSPGTRRMAADVRSVLEALDIERAVVVGHSMGGMVALQLVHDMPTEERGRRLRGLALVSTTGGPATRLPGLDGMARLAGPVSARALRLADRWAVRTVASDDLRWWITRLGFGADAPAAQVRYVERLHWATPPDTVSGLLPSLAVFDLSGWLSHVDLPTLVVVGTHDHLIPPRHALRTAGAIPRAALVEFPRCGHMPMLERRREFSRLLDEFAAKIA